MSLEDLFCDVDEFCQRFLPTWHRQLLTDGTRQRRRTSRLTLSEIMTILVYFHQSQYRNFKAFYLLCLCQHCRGVSQPVKLQSLCGADSHRPDADVHLPAHPAR